MKKFILMSALALAATSFSVGAKTADELRVYINPGHGGWTPDDRPCTLVGHGAYSRANTDTLSFFESNTDLQKGFGVLEKLISYGLKFDRTLNQTGAAGQVGAARDMSNNIVMSRVKNGPYYDDNGTANQLINDGKTVPEDIYIYNRNLSEICAEVDANNFDMFISIHSNAATEGTNTNYPLFLYRGYDDLHADDGVTVEHQTTSKDMASKCWPYAFGNEHMMWTYYSMTNMNLRGDISFYGGSSTRTDPTYGPAKGYLGVLKHHVPGFLVEGYFHTYQPARHRAMNWNVCDVEGYAYARGIADYFGLQKESTGTIYGIVRDEHEKFTDAAYKPNITTADAYKPLNGATVTLKQGENVVATYTTDNYYNGAFVFEGVQPGDYTLEFSCPEYLPCDPVAVTVKAAETVYPTATMVNENWTPPTIIYENYPDLVGENNKGILVGDDYKFNAKFENLEIPQLAGKNVRRVVNYNGKLYILALDRAQKPNPTIVVFDPADQSVTEVSTNGTEGSELNVADIQVSADGVLIACAKELCHFSDAQVGLDREDTDPEETRGEFNVYKWANDEATGLPAGEPQKWFSSLLSGNMYKAYVGESMAYSGTTTEGELITTAESWYGSGNMFFNHYAIIDGALASESKLNNNGGWANKKTLGEGFTFTTSPLDADHYIVTSPNMPAYSVEFTNPSGVTTGADNTANIARASAFRMSGHSLVAVPLNSGNANGGVTILDITNGVNSPAVVITEGTIASALDAPAATVGNVSVKTDDEGNVKAAYINLALVRDGKISYFTTEGVEQPVNPVAYAYGLNATTNEDKVAVNYGLTNEAVSASLVLSKVGGTEEDKLTYALANTKGEHSFEFDRADLQENAQYTWEVVVNSKSNAVAGVSKSYSLPTLARGSVLAITDPEQASFGYVAISQGKAAGVDLYDPQGTQVGDKLFKGSSLWSTGNQSDPFRGAEREGKFMFAAWGDAACGITYFDPMNVGEGVKPFFAGEKNSAGAYIYNGVNLGGGTSGICVVGTGENTKVYSFSEDHDTSIAPANRVVRYDVGNSWLVTEAPVATGVGGAMLNTNCDMVGFGDGYFISQVRSAGNNTYGCPGFAYWGTDNEQKLNSADEANKDWINSCNSAIAISRDGKLLAIGTCDSKIIIADVVWNDGTPSITKRYEIATPNISWATARFDYAGNLYYYGRESQTCNVYSLAELNPSVSTPAPKDNIISGVSGVGVIDADEAVNDAPVYYYNLQGIQVSAENLTPGIYVRVQGKDAQKVLIK